MECLAACRGGQFEAEEENRFCFDVDISAPLVGLIVAYRGTASSRLTSSEWARH
jgi:Domain of unknown function (DUF4166)